MTGLLNKDHLVLTRRAEEPCEARASASFEVAQSSSRALPASLVTKSVERICAGGTLLQLTRRSPEPRVAQTAHALDGVPGRGVHPPRLVRQDLLRVAEPAVVALVEAGGSLAGQSVVTSEALAHAGLAVAHAFVGALHPGVQVVGTHHGPHPRKVLGARPQGAVRTSPFGLSVQPKKAGTIVVNLTGAVRAAVVVTHTRVTRPFLVEDYLSPQLLLVCRCTCRH